MTKTAKRVKVVKPKVGRPVGSAKKVSDAERIRRVLNQYGVDYPTADVKKALTSWKNGSKVAKAFRTQGKTLDVKISQVRSTLQAKLGLPTRKGKGRMTNAEKELIKVKLELERTQAELASLKAPVVEESAAVVAESQAVEATPVAEAPVADAALTLDPVPAPVAA